MGVNGARAELQLKNAVGAQTLRRCGAECVPGEEQPERNGGRPIMGPSTHLGLPSVAGACWFLSHELLGRKSVGCSWPEPALCRSWAHLLFPQKV